MRHKILLQTNAPWLKTGLSESGRVLMNWLARRDKYDLVYYCTQVGDNDPNLARMPYKAYGCIPSAPHEQQEMQQLQSRDPGRLRDIMYGSRFIDEIVKKERPSIYIGSDDIWSFGSQYFKAEWFKRINSILHITIDSVPVLEQAYEQALATKHFFSWAAFAGIEMKKRGPQFNHVDHIYGASDTNKFKPVSREQKLQTRKLFGIDPNCTIFIFLGRNQLRKCMGELIQAFALFKRDNPGANAKLLLHTAYSESGNGYDIPRLAKYFGLKPDDILCTMFCRNCGAWEIRPYTGEDTDCRFCGAQKSQVSANIVNGVPNEELHLVYGVADAAISAFTSGGLEFHNVNSLLCGLPLACTNYSCGEDFCKQRFVTPIKWHARHETGTNFIKAANDIGSIKGFMEQTYRMSARDRQEIGEKGRAWAASEFDINTIGTKWEKLFDSMPHPDWSSIKLEYVPKNPAFPVPQIQDPLTWVKALYKGILNMDMADDDSGVIGWVKGIEAGNPRENIYSYFLSVAQKENAERAPKMDFGDLFDKGGKARILFVMKESGGDLFIATSLFPGLKSLYPEADLYVACDPKFNDILAGNEHVHKVLPYQPIMEQEMAMKEYVDFYYYPALPTQRQLAYLTKDRIGLELEAVK